MNKFLTKIIGATLAAAMMIGVGAGLNYVKPAKLADAANGDSITGGDMSNGVTSGWTTSGTGTYSGNGIKFDSANDYIQSPDISSNSLKDVKVSLKAGHNGGSGSVLTIATYNASGNVIDSEEFTPTEAYNSQSTVYDFELTGSVTIKHVRITMSSKYKNLGMKYCEVFDNSTGGGDTPTTYTVTYNDNNKTSGSVPTDSTRYESGQTITVAGNTGNLVRTGYTWSGWSTNPDGSGTAYGPAPYTTTYTVGTSNVNFYPIWVKNVTPLPESGTISITGTNPTIGGYGDDVEYVVEEDNTPDSEFGFNCTQIMKSNDNLQFKANQGVLYSTTPLQYIRNVTVSGNNSSDAVIRYGTSQNSGCTSETVGTENTYFKVSNSAGNARYWTITVTYSLEAPAALTGLRIAGGLDSVRKTYDDGEVFDPTGLVIQAQWNSVWDEANNVLNDVSWAPTVLTGGTTSVTGTYTYGVESRTVTVEGLTVAAPNVIIDGDTNKPAGLGTNTSTTATGQGQINSTGVNYGYYGLAIYQSNNNLEFNRNVSGAYLGNNESYGKYIRKIRLTLYSADFTKLTMFKGDSAIPGTTSVSTETNSGTTRIYNMGNNCEFFALKQTTTGTWIQIVKMEIFLGSNAPVVSSIDATVNNGTYYAGSTLSASDFNVTAHWTEGKADTNPTSEFTWTVNGVENGTLISGDNTVVVTYKGQSDTVIVYGTPASASSVVQNMSTQTSLSYRYGMNYQTVSDTLTRELTGVSGTSYVSWSGKTSTSSAVYAGNSAGGTDNSGPTIQLRSSSNSGIITTASGGKARKITVVWNGETASSRTIDIYGKNTAYSSPADLYGNNKGTSLGSIVYGTGTELTITGDYEFIAIRSNSGALYLDSITVDWSGNPSYTYSDISIRFGANMTKALWDELDTNEHLISGFGVIIADGDLVQNDDDMADALEDAVSSTVTTTFTQQVYAIDYFVPVADMASTIGVDGNNYFWNLRWTIDEANMDKMYTAAAYIKVGNEYVLMKIARESVVTLAQDYLDNRGCTASTAEGSLKAIVDNA